MPSIAFSDTTNKNGAIQMCEFYTNLGDAGISGNATLLKQFTHLINVANSQVWHLLFEINSGWKYDDSNNTDLPQATQDLTNAVAKYALPSGTMTVNRVEVLDINGDYQKLQPLRLEEISGAVDEFYGTDAMPKFYRLVGTTIELFPAPSTTYVTTTAGLKVYFDRGAFTFTSDDTTQTFGFSAEYHDIPPRKASIEWMKVFKPDSPALPRLIEDDIKRETQLTEYEAKKFKDVKPSLSTVRGSFR